MADVLLMSTAEKGHLNPLIGVAQWLKRRGHRVGWTCLPAAPDYVTDMGIEEVPVDLSGEDEDQDDDFVTEGAELAELVRDGDRLSEWIRELLIGNVEERVEPTRRAFRSWEPDVVAVDSMLYEGIVAAHCEEIPYACISTTLNMVAPEDWEGEYRRHMDGLSEERRELFESFGLSPKFKFTACFSPHLNIVFATRDYVQKAGDVPPETHLVGPSFPPGERGDEVDFPWEELDDRPIVYASFGSQIYHQPEMFERIARATEPLDVQVVFSCGDLAESEWAQSLPDHVVAAGYTPQRELLERADLMITHGGANSVREALTAAVPILISPVCNDQPIQAHFVRERGVGTELDLYEATDEEARTAIGRLLERDTSERRTVEEVAEGFRNQDGARRTAELVEEIVP